MRMTTMRFVTKGVLLAFLAGAAQAQTWTSTTGGNWSDGTRWSSPPANDGTATIVFGTNPATLTSTVDTPYSVAGLRFHTGSGAYTLSGSQITLGTGGLVNAPGVILATTVVSGSPTATVSASGIIDANSLTPGSSMTTGNGVPTGTTVAANLTATTFTMSASATANDNARTRTYGTARTITLNNALLVNVAQTWQMAASAGAVLNLNGNLSGTGNITIGPGNGSNAATLPTLRLLGSNSGYSGTMTTTGATSEGILLGSAAAMTSGLIDLNSGNRNLWLTGGAGGGTYTFGIDGTESTGSRVKFRSAGTAGMYLTGGDTTWNPGGATDYVWSGTTTTTIDFNGGNETAPRTLNLGNAAGTFTVSAADKTLRNAAGGNNPARVTLLSALKDGNEATQRTLNTDLRLFTLTQPAVNVSATKPLKLTVTGGATAITNVDQLPAGNLNLSGGMLILDSVSWSAFTTARGSAPTGTVNGTWQISGSGFAGLAARTAAVTVSGGAATDFDRSFTLGSAVRAADGTSAYADKGVKITQDIALSAANSRTIQVGGALAFSGGVYGGYGTQSPIHEISGTISGGAAARTLTLTGASNGGTAAGAYGGVLRLSGNNTFQGTVGMGHTPPTGDTSTGWGVLLATSDAAFGDAANPVVFMSSTPSVGSGWLGLFDGSGTYSRGFRYDLRGGVTTDRPWGFGAYAGNVVYTGTSTVQDQSGQTTSAGTYNLNLHAEGSSTLSLGVSGGTAATFATTFASANNHVVQLEKTGSGTLILRNAVYAPNGGNSFAWQIGRGGNPATVTTVQFDGAVRETATSGSAGSLATTFGYRLGGGVLELDNAVYAGVFSKNARATAAADTVTWQGGGGGGFAAYGGDTTVTLVNGTAGNTTYLGWTGSAFPTGGSAVPTGAPLIFGSKTGDATVLLNNAVTLGSAGSGDNPRAVLVVRDTNDAKPEVVVLGPVVDNTGNNALAVIGDGVLALAGACTYGSPTRLYGGTLLVNGSLDTRANGVTVNSGATLGGSGSISRPVTVVDGGIVAPGNQGIGTLTVTGAVSFAASSVLNVQATATSDKLAVVGNVTLDGTVNVVSATQGGTFAILSYTGTLTDNGLVVGTLPKDFTGRVEVDTVNRLVNLVLGASGGTVLLVR